MLGDPGVVAGLSSDVQVLLDLCGKVMLSGKSWETLGESQPAALHYLLPQ